MKKLIFIGSGILLLVIAFFAFYTHWNAASPAKTCASCHEITQSVDMWAGSAHRNMACQECHGTALSEGLHSLKEKANMVFHHILNTEPGKIRITEEQRMEVMQRCKGCHETEYAKWNSGGHAMNYSEVFLNTAHNRAEPIHEDCLRCHGMFFDNGTARDIAEPLDTIGPWKLKLVSLGMRPAIPCFSCHQIHQTGYPGMRHNLEVPASLHYSRMKKTYTAFYYRRDSAYFPVSSLVIQKINYNSVPVKISTDPNQNLCVQCHSPNAFNMAGTNDDRTPRGVHEGLSCLACHDSHSNSAIASCKYCHPAISNCKLDVEKMNTTYMDKTSKNNIHYVACTDCHFNGLKVSR